MNWAYDPVFSPLYMSDCVRYTIESASYCSVPARVINVGGAETVTQVEIFNILGARLGVERIFREADKVPLKCRGFGTLTLG